MTLRRADAGRACPDTATLGRRAFCALAGAAGLAALAGCTSAQDAPEQDDGQAEQSDQADQAAAEEPVKRSTFAFNTLVSLTVYGAAEQDVADCLALCSDYENLLSAHLEGSDVARINAAGGEPVEVDPQTAELLGRALEYAEASDGLFDVTVGAVSLLWDFEQAVKPDDDAIEQALAHVGWQGLSVDGTTVTLADPDARIDLGGIAKGWIAERLVERLVEAGATGGLVSLGTSSTVLFGAKPDGSPWRIGLRDPRGSVSDLLGVATFEDASVTSSGLYDQQFEQDGHTYWHILDPRTGYPAQTDMLGDTVVTQDPTFGDALSTMLFVMGIDGAAAWLAERYPQVPAMFVGEDDEPVYVNGFEELMAAEGAQ